MQGEGGQAGRRRRGRSCGWGRILERRPAGRASWAGGQCGQGPSPLGAALEGALSARETQATRPPRPRRVAGTAPESSRSPLDWSARSSRGDLPPAPWGAPSLATTNVTFHCIASHVIVLSWNSWLRRFILSRTLVSHLKISSRLLNLWIVTYSNSHQNCASKDELSRRLIPGL